MIELLIQDNYKLLQDFKKLTTFTVGLRGTSNVYAVNVNIRFTQFSTCTKSLFLDYGGDQTDLQDVAGLQQIIALSVGDIEDTNEQKLTITPFPCLPLKDVQPSRARKFLE